MIGGDLLGRFFTPRETGMSKEVPSLLDYTIPLFVQHPFMLTGRDDKTVSASGTFVKFQGRH